MVPERGSSTGKALWAYAYRIVPPVPADRLHTVSPLLDRGHTDAERRTRIWAGRLVVDPQVTHILIVSDSPEQDGEINRLLEAELRQLETGFSLTAPMAVEDDDGSSPEAPPSSEDQVTRAPAPGGADPGDASSPSRD